MGLADGCGLHPDTQEDLLAIPRFRGADAHIRGHRDLALGSATHGFYHPTRHAEAQDFFANAGRNRRTGLIVRIEARADDG